MIKDKDIKRLLDDSNNSKQIITRIWDLCLHYLEGRQHLVYDRSMSNYVVGRELQGNRQRATINLLLNLYRNIISRLSINYPSVAVLPASPTPDDIVKAKSSETALHYYWNSADCKQLLEKAIKWLVSCGNVGLNTYYDPDKECVMTEVISPYDIFFEKGAIDYNDSRFVAIRRFHVREELAEMFPEHKEYIMKAPSYTQQDQTSDYGYTAQNHSVPQGRLETYDFYDKHGELRICLNEKVLFKTKTPKGIMPFQHIRYTDVPNRIWGLGLLEPLIELQTLYNTARAQIIKNVELMSNPKWLVPKTAGVNPNAITNRAGEKIFYNPAGGTPQQIPMAGLPAYVIQNIQQISEEMKDVAGIHSVSLGRRQVGVTSGKGIEALATQDISQLQITQQQIEDAVKQMAKVVLVMMKTYYKEAKFVRMLDRTGKVIFKQLRDTDIVDDPEIFIEAGSMFRAEADDKDARIVQMLQLGLIDKETALKEMTFRTGNAYALEEMEDLAHAEEILAAVADGQQVEIFATDNLDAFMEVFSNYIKSDDFYSKPLERQEYIRDVFHAIIDKKMGGQTNIMRDDKVYPRQVNNQEQLAENVVQLNSPEARMAQLNQGLDLADQQAELNSLQRDEATFTRDAMGGGETI